MEKDRHGSGLPWNWCSRTFGLHNAAALSSDKINYLISCAMELIHHGLLIIMVCVHHKADGALIHDRRFKTRDAMKVMK